MRNKDMDYLNMVNVVDEVLAKYEPLWIASNPAVRQITIIRNAHAELDGVQQNGNVTTVGITQDKGVAKDYAIALGLKLSGFGQSYALENKNNSLYAQVKIYQTQLESMRDEELEQRLVQLHKDLVAIGTPLEEFGGTKARLDNLLATVKLFKTLKATPQVVIATRKGHNSTIPELMTALRDAFKILDGLVPH